MDTLSTPNPNEHGPCQHCGQPRPTRSNPYCKPCRAAYGRARRILGVDKAYARQVSKEGRHAFKARVIAHMGGKCQRCGFTPSGPEQYPAIHVHHPERDRVWAMATAASRSWEAIEAELMRCELLCANCHAIEHTNDGSKAGRPRKAMDAVTLAFLEKLRTE